MNITFYRILDERNAGDMACTPQPFFEEFSNVVRDGVTSVYDELAGHEVRHEDIRKWTPDKHRVSIFGGGGLFYHELHDVLAGAAEARIGGRTGPIIIWGAGENMHNQTKLLHPQYLESFDLVGTRDWFPHTGFKPPLWVPCSSCLYSEIRTWRQSASIFPVVVYEHFADPITRIPNIFPRMTNAASEGDFNKRIRFLSTGQTVVTNSYHGAYWAALLGKSVAWCLGSINSSRFHHTPFGAPFIEDISEIGSAIKVNQGFHAECVDANNEFHKKVMKVINEFAG